ncbi:MAG: ABC transporter substrate-binding protein [Lachnospiraceae bacterium]|nr:ABC transporter substrate-binding protein [Lachnospiraceae bacterium]
MKRQKKNWIIMLLACVLMLGLMAGCSKGEVKEPEEEAVTLHVGALKGPTTMGLLFLMEDAKEGKTKNSYEFQMATGADELLPLMVSGKLDIALVPANVAAILYQKTEGGVAVVDINTLGVLYLVSSDTSVQCISDLKGRTVYLTGKGTTPDCVLQFLIKNAGLSEGDVTLEYCSEASEVAAILAEKPDAIGFLPQPFVTAAGMQNENLQVMISANDMWLDAFGKESSNALVTGVTVVRKEILEKYPQAIATFLEEHEASANAINEDLDTGAKLAVEAGIVGKEPIAKKAIPKCNITCVTGNSMKRALKAYLEVIYAFDSSMVGGKLPEADFYYQAD